MPSRVRVVYRDTQGRIYRGAQATLALQVQAANSFKRLQIKPGWSKLPHWKRARDLYKTEGLGGELLMRRERRSLRSGESRYRHYLRNWELRAPRRPDRAPRQIAAPYVPPLPAGEYPILGARGYHWSWNDQYGLLPAHMAARVNEVLLHGEQYFVADGARWNCHHYIRRIRPYVPAAGRGGNPQRRPRAPGGVGPREIGPGPLIGPYAPAIGIWRA